MGSERQPPLFDLPPPKPVERKVKPIHHPIWTENKARLIERYLYYFVQITHHGTYIDGFAGPQSEAANDGWAAKLVLESEPRWFRHFHLYDIDPVKAEALEVLKRSQPTHGPDGKRINRTIETHCLDFNEAVHQLLGSGVVSEKEAAFCLLDQRTFECEWRTVEALARHKRVGNKIEIFYFFPVKWLDRALSALQDREKLERWWGRSDYEALRDMSRERRVAVLLKRFREELGYASAKPWPIYEREGGGPIMYYMIHATDHSEAPMLMRRAYERAVLPKETGEQLSLLVGSSLARAALPRHRMDVA